MNSKEQDIYNQLQTIESLEKIINNVKDSKTEKIRLRIETKNWFGYDEPHLDIIKNKMYFDKKILLNILRDILKDRKDKLKYKIY